MGLFDPSAESNVGIGMLGSYLDNKIPRRSQAPDNLQGMPGGALMNQDGGFLFQGLRNSGRATPEFDAWLGEAAASNPLITVSLLARERQ